MHPRSVYLIGPMGAGKTCIGKKLAQRIHWKFMDSDSVIEAKTGVDIPTIFEIEGEDGFRNREAQVLQELTAIPKIVLATGGGAILREENQRLMQANGFIIYLSTGIKTQLKRTQRDRSRPLLCTQDRRATLEKLAEQRRPIYERLADLTIETDDQPITESVKFIIAELKKEHIVTAPRHKAK